MSCDTDGTNNCDRGTANDEDANLRRGKEGLSEHNMAEARVRGFIDVRVGFPVSNSVFWVTCLFLPLYVDNKTPGTIPIHPFFHLCTIFRRKIVILYTKLFYQRSRRY